MNERPAMKRILNGVGLFLLLGLAVACNRGKGGSQVDISGSFDDGATPAPSAKARQAAGGAYAVTAVDLVSGQEYPVNVDAATRTFSTRTFHTINLRLSVSRDGQEILSRILTVQDTGASVSRVNVNAVTHVHAQMMMAAVAGEDYDEARKVVFRDIYGTDVLGEGELTIARIAADPARDVFAARVAILAQLVASQPGTSVSALVATVAGAFRQPTVAGVGGAFQRAVDLTTDGSMATAFASAIAGVKTRIAALGLSLAGISVIENEYQNPLLQGMLIPVKQPPVFNAPVDARRTAAPGVLFRYTAPTAGTVDILGVTGYAGAWDSQPDGYWGLQDGGRTIVFMPSQSDVNRTYTFTVTAVGGNGRTVTHSVPVAVKPLELKGLLRKRLGGGLTDTGGAWRPVLGPLATADGTGLCLLANLYTGCRLELYSAAAAASGGDGDLLPMLRYWRLPADVTAVHDLVLRDKYAVVASAGYGTLAYDTSVDGVLPAYLARTMTDPLVAACGEGVYSLQPAGERRVTRASRTLGAPAPDAALSARAAQMSATVIDAYGTYLYLGTAYTATFYDTVTGAFLANAYRSQSAFAFVPDAADNPGRPQFLAGRDVVHRLQVDPPILSYSYLTGVGRGTAAQVMGNGSYGYSAAAYTAGTMEAFSLKGVTHRVSSTDEPGTGPVDFSRGAYESDDPSAPLLSFAIRNVPEGVTAGRSGALVYALGQYAADGASYSATKAGSWYLKTFKAQPGE